MQSRSLKEATVTGCRIILKWISNKYGVRVLNLFLWLRTEMSDSLLSTWHEFILPTKGNTFINNFIEISSPRKGTAHGTYFLWMESRLVDGRAVGVRGKEICPTKRHYKFPQRGFRVLAVTLEHLEHFGLTF